MSERLGRLLAIRDAVEGAIAAELEQEQGCPHPEGQREYAGEMGNVQGFTCRACGTTVAAEAQPGA